MKIKQLESFIGDKFPDWVGDEVEREVDKRNMSYDDAWGEASQKYASLRFVAPVAEVIELPAERPGAADAYRHAA